MEHTCCGGKHSQKKGPERRGFQGKLAGENLSKVKASKGYQKERFQKGYQKKRFQKGNKWKQSRRPNKGYRTIFQKKNLFPEGNMPRTGKYVSYTGA